MPQYEMTSALILSNVGAQFDLSYPSLFRSLVAPYKRLQQPTRYSNVVSEGESPAMTGSNSGSSLECKALYLSEHFTNLQSCPIHLQSRNQQPIRQFCRHLVSHAFLT